MDFDNTIRPWLLTVSEAWGVRQAHPYRWHDADKSENEVYFSYRPLRSRPHVHDIVDRSEKDGTTVTHRASQRFIVEVRIDVFRSKDGLNELSRMIPAIQHNQILRDTLSARGVAFRSVVTPPEDISTWDDERIDYQHFMVVDFYENPEYEIVETNGVVETLKFNLESGSKQVQVDSTGVTIPAP